MKRSLFAELKRRHVYRVAIAYVIAAWVLLQLASIIFPMFGAPDWVLKVFLAVLMLGFPIALILAWAFEMTPEGVRRTQPADSPEARAPEQHRHVGRKLDFAIIAVLALALVVVAWRLWESRKATPLTSPAVATESPKVSRGASAPAVSSPAPETTVIPKKSIAVLPFANMSADKNNKYFADGMQDLILTKLAGIGDLKVISRTSTAKYNSHPDDLKTIAQQLGVATILEGSVQKAGDQVLINVQLINAQTEAHIWAEAYTRTLDNVFGVEGEVAEKIATALKARLSPAESKRLATSLSGDPAANDLFLRAEYLANRGESNYDGSLYRQAIPLYRQALARDPGFALARARLSNAESGLIWFGGAGSDTRELIADAAAQARQALAEQPDLAAAHMALGYVYYWDQQNFTAALEAFRAVLKLQPNDANAIASTGYVLRRHGQFDAAINALQQALELDPRDPVVTVALGETLAAVRRYAEAERMAQRALALNPDGFSSKQLYSAIILKSSGDVGRALDAAQGDDPGLRAYRVGLLMLQRKYREAITLLESIPDTPDNFNYSSGPRALPLADLYRLAGDEQRARTLYAQALPLLRKQLAALAGNAMKMSFVWSHIAGAEMGLGKTDAALGAIAKSQALISQSGDLFFTPRVTAMNAGRYAQAGRADLAVPLLAKALAAPGAGVNNSPMLLKINPTWDPIRKDPRFQALPKKYAEDRPASVPDETGQRTQVLAGKS